MYCNNIYHSPIACSEAACKTLANILLKAFVINFSDKQRSVGMLEASGKVVLVKFLTVDQVLM